MWVLGPPSTSLQTIVYSAKASVLPPATGVKVRSSGQSRNLKLVKWSRYGLETVKGSPGDQWAWLMPDSQGQGQIFGAVKR